MGTACELPVHRERSAKPTKVVDLVAGGVSASPGRPVAAPQLLGRVFDVAQGDAGASDFDDAVQHLDNLGKQVCGFLEVLLSDAGVNVHSVSYRVKSRASADNKIASKSDRYDGYSDLMDLLGIRIITYFPDEVDQANRVVEQAFVVDQENSVDKRETLAPDAFGYLSAHFVVELPPDRLRMPEYKQSKGVKFEIQIRTVLQHAWAEIEHDLGYKTEQSLPRPFRRRFSRLAGLLEIADSEFKSIRDDLVGYDKDVQSRVQNHPSDVGLNLNSLRAWQSHSGVMSRVDSAISTASGVPLMRIPGGTDGPDQRALDELASLGIDSVAELESALVKHESSVVDLAKLWFEDTKRARGERATSKRRGIRVAAHGISLRYLVYVLSAHEDDERVRELFERYEPNDADERLERLRRLWPRVGGAQDSASA